MFKIIFFASLIKYINIEKSMLKFELDMVKCRHCGGEELRKDEIVKGKQCKRTTRANYQKYKYSLSKRLKVLKGYLEGLGIMALERFEGVPDPLIIKWFRNYAKILNELITKATVAKTIENVEILEIDELLLYRNKSCC